MKSPKLRGFTLIEMIIVITISGIIVAGSGLLLIQGITEYLTGKTAIANDWQASMAIERMTRDLHLATAITAATNTSITMVDIYGNTVTYTIAGNQLLWNTQVLANHVQSLNFAYYDNNGLSTVITSAICYVGIALTIAYTTTTTNFSTKVALWNT